jgi:hypothetical protein
MSERSSTQKGIIQSRAWRLFASVALLFLLGVSSGCNQVLGVKETQLRGSMGSLVVQPVSLQYSFA